MKFKHPHGPVDKEVKEKQSKLKKTVKVIKAQTRAPVDFVKLGFRADDQANGSRSSTCDFASEGTKGSMMSRTVAGSRISHSLTNVIPD